MDKYITVEEIAKALSRDDATIRRWLNNKEMPGYKLGGRWQILRSEYTTWLNAKKEGI